MADHELRERVEAWLRENFERYVEASEAGYMPDEEWRGMTLEVIDLVRDAPLSVADLR